MSDERASCLRRYFITSILRRGAMTLQDGAAIQNGSIFSKTRTEFLFTMTERPAIAPLERFGHAQQAPDRLRR
jgi:hypothetical protein